MYKFRLNINQEVPIKNTNVKSYKCLKISIKLLLAS